MPVLWESHLGDDGKNPNSKDDENFHASLSSHLWKFLQSLRHNDNFVLHGNDASFRLIVQCVILREQPSPDDSRGSLNVFMICSCCIRSDWFWNAKTEPS